MAMERDEVLDSLQQIGEEAANIDAILNEMSSNQKNFATNCNTKLANEGTLSDLGKLSDIEKRNQCLATLQSLEVQLQTQVRTHQSLMARFENSFTENFNRLSLIHMYLINERIARWKFEQQKIDSKINPTQCHSVHLDRIQLWCGELAELLRRQYNQVNGVKVMLETGSIAGIPEYLAFVNNGTAEALRLLKELLNETLIVEKQPQLVIKTKTKFKREVVVSSLIGDRLFEKEEAEKGPTLTSSIISEEQAGRLPLDREMIQIIADVTGGQSIMEYNKELGRCSTTFKSMQLKELTRSGRKGIEKVNEEKLCLYFVCKVKVVGLDFNLSTISLPLVVVSHGSQEALAMGTMCWDYAFSVFGRTPFAVSNVAPWTEVESLLSAEFFKVTGRGLTRSHLDCLAIKAFPNQTSPPRDVTWEQICKSPLPGCSFTFWGWFHAALKLIEKKETHLKDIWIAGCIEGFIGRDAAIQLLSGYQPGTFLLRFSDSILGAITIVLVDRPGNVISLIPYELPDLERKNIASAIADITDLKWVYQQPQCAHKDGAFGMFYPPNLRSRRYVGLKQQVEQTRESSASPQSSQDNEQIRSPSGSAPLPPSPGNTLNNSSTTSSPVVFNDISYPGCSYMLVGSAPQQSGGAKTSLLPSGYDGADISPERELHTPQSDFSGQNYYSFPVVPSSSTQNGATSQSWNNSYGTVASPVEYGASQRLPEIQSIFQHLLSNCEDLENMELAGCIGEAMEVARAETEAEDE